MAPVHNLDPIMRALIAQGMRTSLPGGPLRQLVDGARVAPIYWNPVTDQIEPGAGAAWVRRQWIEQGPERTVLVGFDSEAEFRRSYEGSLLDTQGTTYVSLATCGEPIEAIGAAIQAILAIEPGPLDLASRSRNASELATDWRNWRHVLRGRCAQPRGALLRLTPGREDASRRKAYADLSVLPTDLLDSQRQALLDLFARSKRHDPLARALGLALVEKYSAAASDWQQIVSMIGQPYSLHRAAESWEKLADMMSGVEAVERAIEEFCSRLLSSQGSLPPYARVAE